MSYTIRLETVPCPTCGRRSDAPYLPDPTYNLTPIFDRALTGEPLPNPEVSEGAVVLLGGKTDRPRGLRVLSGMKGRDTIELLRAAVAHLFDPKQEASLRELEPDNKWGDLEGAREVMSMLLKAAEEFPDHVWDVR